MKNKKVLLILVILILMMLFALVGIFFIKPFIMQQYGKEGGFTKAEIEKAEKIANPRYLSILHINGDRYDISLSSQKINIDYIVIFDKNGEVIETRVKETGYTNNELEEKNTEFNKLKQPTLTYNHSIKNDSLYYSQSMWNGDSKEKVLNTVKDLENLKYEEL